MNFLSLTFAAGIYVILGARSSSYQPKETNQCVRYFQLCSLFVYWPFSVSVVIKMLPEPTLVMIPSLHLRPRLIYLSVRQETQKKWPK